MATMLVENGTTYRGIININYAEWKVAAAGGESYIKEQFEKQGFSNVSVWLDDDLDNLPSDWPADKRQDNSESGNTWAWIEVTWSKTSTQLPSSDPKFYIVSRWIQKQAEQPIVPVQPTCRSIGSQCAVNADCCNQICTNGLCADVSTPIQPQPACIQVGGQCAIHSDCCSQYCINGYCGVQPGPVQTQPPTCAWFGESCENLKCCEDRGLLCLDDINNYVGGGKRCMEEKETKVDQIKEEVFEKPLKQPTSPWWYILGSVLVGGVVTAVGVKVLSSSKKKSTYLGVSEPASSFSEEQEIENYKQIVEDWMIRYSKDYVSAIDLARGASDNFELDEYDSIPEWVLDIAFEVKKYGKR